MEKTKSASECAFGDIENYDYTLKPTIVEACEYGLVRGFQGNYMPNNLITEAEAITVIVRSLPGFGMQDESGTPRWREYHDIGSRLKILDNE